ncbi:MAG: restriction endonuclease subunit S [Chthoniobacteraceae bacterium]
MKLKPFKKAIDLLCQLEREKRQARGKPREQNTVSAEMIAGLPQLPSGWVWVSPDQISSSEPNSLTIGPFGSNLTISDYKKDGVPLVFVRNIRANDFTRDLVFVSPEKAKELNAHSVQPGDILITKMGDPPGDAVLYPEGLPVAIITADCIKFRISDMLGTAAYFVQAIHSSLVKQQMAILTSGVAQQKVSLERFKTLALPFPPLPEQRKIAKILSTWDEALEKLDALIAAKERGKKALIQQLLTGKKRLPGFDRSNKRNKRDRFGSYPADWRRLKLGCITTEVGTRNAKGKDIPVLSCTKHRGLVLSEDYFGKCVYAEDTSNYRIVCRGEFAYATNHIEEGSIGYQNICEAGLVSPIYTVFKTAGTVDDNYLFRVLKSPLLVHLYRVNTSSSVDRRGSLRYGEFAQIHIWLPSKEEQIAIATVFDTCDAEIRLLRAQRAAIDRQKRGLMQRLLTGKTRVKI